MSKLPAPAIDWGLQILSIIAKNNEVGFNKIQEMTGINANSLNRYLTTLQELDYIYKGTDAKYRPGLQLAVLNGDTNVYNLIKRRAEEYLIQLEREFKITAMLFGISRRGIYCIDKVSCPDNVSMQEVGSYLHTNISCAWGMLYLKNMTEEEIHQYMIDHHKGAYEIARHDLFYNAVRFTKEHGYCDDKLTSRSGIRKIAFPVFDSCGHLIGAIATACFSSLMDEKKAEIVTERLREYAGLISINGERVPKTT